jgi:hypothetical protein
MNDNLAYIEANKRAWATVAQAGLHILWLHEFDWLFYRLPVDGVYKDEQGHWQYPQNRQKLPLTFSLKAVVR